MLSCPRLDNQSHCYTGLMALLDHSKDLSEDTGVSMLVCFDHEVTNHSPCYMGFRKSCKLPVLGVFR